MNLESQTNPISLTVTLLIMCIIINYYNFNYQINFLYNTTSTKEKSQLVS